MTCPHHHPSVRLAGVLLLLAACSSTATDDLQTSTSVGDGLGTDGAAEGTGALGDDDDGAGGTAGDDDDDDEPGGSTGDPNVPDDDGDGGEPPLEPGCPDEWPRGWVFCEDFTDLEAPLQAFSEYASEGAFDIDPDYRAMRADYRKGIEDAGWVLIGFGTSPIPHEGGVTHADDQTFEEIYWRVKIKHELGWPDIGPGWLGRATSFATDDWAQALVAQLRSAGQSTQLEAVPFTCVNGESVMCDGYDDMAALETLETVVGETELFSSELSGQWHCVEAHVRLNTPGQSDGVFEFWVDENLEGVDDTIDWRGAWGEFGLNAVMLENFWPGGATKNLSRWMDDIVVSTEPIGCD